MPDNQTDIFWGCVKDIWVMEDVILTLHVNTSGNSSKRELVDEKLQKDDLNSGILIRLLHLFLFSSW